MEPDLDGLLSELASRESWPLPVGEAESMLVRLEAVGDRVGLVTREAGDWDRVARTLGVFSDYLPLELVPRFFSLLEERNGDLLWEILMRVNDDGVPTITFYRALALVMAGAPVLVSERFGELLDLTG